MVLQSVLVIDTNIWIDLENGGILVEIFRLPYQFLIPDFAIPELVRPRWETLEVLGLKAHELPAEQVFELIQLRQVHKNLSIIDLAAFLLAKMLDETLLTGDWRLNELANASGLSVHGALWLLDEMVHFKALTPGQAATALKRMLELGARLPAVEEVFSRSRAVPQRTLIFLPQAWQRKSWILSVLPCRPYPTRGVDTFIHDTTVNAARIWTSVTLGGEGFLSSPATFHSPPGLERLLGLRIIAFIFRGPTERTIICCLGFEWAGRFQFECSFGMKPKHGQSQDPDHGEVADEDEKKEWVCVHPVIQREW